MRQAISELCYSLMLGLWVAFLARPFLLAWRTHGSHERYVWITGGPYPYDNLGGEPFWSMVYSRLFASGIFLTSFALILRSAVQNHTMGASTQSGISAVGILAADG